MQIWQPDGIAKHLFVYFTIIVGISVVHQMSKINKITVMVY